MTKKTNIYISLTISILFIFTFFGCIEAEQVQNDKVDEWLKSHNGFKNIQAYRFYRMSLDIYLDSIRLKKIEPGKSPYKYSAAKKKEMWDQSIELIKKSINIEPGNLKSIEHYADLLEAQKNYKKALNYYAEAYELGMKEIYYRRKLFYIYKKMGDLESYKRELYIYADLIKKSKNSEDFESLFVQLLFAKPINLNLLREYYDFWMQVPGPKDDPILRSVRQVLNIEKE